MRVVADNRTVGYFHTRGYGRCGSVDNDIFYVLCGEHGIFARVGVLNPVYDAECRCAGSPHRLVVAVMGGNRLLARELNEVSLGLRCGFVDNISVGVDIVPVPALLAHGGIRASARPAAEGVARTLRLADAVNALVLRVNRLDSVAAVAEVEVYGVVVAVVVDLEHGRAVGCDRVRLVEQTREAVDLYLLKRRRTVARFAVEILALFGQIAVERVQVVVDVLLVVPRGVV